MSSPACSDRWKCGISRGSPAISSNRASSISMLSSEDRRRRFEPRLGGEQALAQCAEAAVVIGDVDAGQDDLLRAAVDLAGDGVADRFERQRAARPARLPDRAEGAAMVAAGLDRDEALDLALASRRRTGVMTSFAAKALSLLGISDDAATPRHGLRTAARLELGRAAGDEDLGASGRCRCARRIAWRVWRTASLVTAQLLTTIQSSSGGRGPRNRLAFGEIEAAAESDRLDAHRSASRSSSPSNTWRRASRACGSARPVPS